MEYDMEKENELMKKIFGWDGSDFLAKKMINTVLDLMYHMVNNYQKTLDSKKEELSEDDYKLAQSILMTNLIAAATAVPAQMTIEGPKCPPQVIIDSIHYHLQELEKELKENFSNDDLNLENVFTYNNKPKVLN